MTTKTVKQLSSLTTYREREPTNPKAAYKGFNMVFDHSRQMAVIPDRNPRVLVEATNHHPTGLRSQTMTMNRSGVSACSDNRISVGGSPDQPGRLYETGNVSRPKIGRGTSKPKFQRGK